MMMFTPSGIDTMTWNPLASYDDALRLAQAISAEPCIDIRRAIVCVSVELSEARREIGALNKRLFDELSAARDEAEMKSACIKGMKDVVDELAAELAEARENEKQLGSAYEHNALAAMRFRDELAQARQEAKRFREALEKIASDRYNFRDFCDIARAALEGKP